MQPNLEIQKIVHNFVTAVIVKVITKKSYKINIVNMSQRAKALDFEQAINLLPIDFLPYRKLPSRKKLLQTPKGIVAFRQSSLLDCGEWKTSYNEESIRTEIDYLCYALGYDGILILSRQVLLSFEKENYNGRWVNNGYPIHVFKDNNRYIWHGMNGNTKDLTKYFIPFARE